MNDKLKNGNSLETQFWSGKVEIDPNSPLTKLIDKVWNSKEDYIPTDEEKERFNKEMKEYHKNKRNKNGTKNRVLLLCKKRKMFR